MVTTGFRDQIQLYVNNAITLSRSLRQRNLSFTLLTNNVPLVDELARAKNATLNIEEIPFMTEVPTGVRFFSAHFKLDAFRFFATLDKEYVALIDSDVICVNDVPPGLARAVSRQTSLWYDITDQVVPAYGHEVILRDLDTILGAESEGRWAGGEFVAGPPAFFARLVKEGDTVYANYIRNINLFHHIGDEPVVTAALELLRKKGVYVADAGLLGVIGRYWNSRTLHTQKPFECYEHCFLLHLPSDKRFLADLADRDTLDREEFLRLYAIRRSRYRRKLRRLKKRFLARW